MGATLIRAPTEKSFRTIVYYVDIDSGEILKLNKLEISDLYDIILKERHVEGYTITLTYHVKKSNQLRLFD